MTKAEQREAAEVLRRVVERIDRSEVDAPMWPGGRPTGTGAIGVASAAQSADAMRVKSLPTYPRPPRPDAWTGGLNDPPPRLHALDEVS
jgi:hypothetical protein